MSRHGLLFICALLTAAVAGAQPTPPQKRLAPAPGDLWQANVTKHTPGLAQRGLTSEITDSEATSPAANPWFRVFALDGTVVRSWRNPLPNWAFAELVKPLSYGHILAMVYDRATAGYGPRDKKLVELDWDGNVVWEFDARPRGFQLHHDFERLENGRTLVIAQKERLVPSINLAPILDDNIWEVNREGLAVWQWSAAAHFNQMGFTAQQRSYIANLPGRAPYAVFHMNSIQTLPPNQWEATDPRFKTGNILVSLRDTNLVFIIDKATKAIVWRYSGAIGQHHPRMIPQGLPGAGNILLFDNGGSSGAPPVFRGHSRVFELNPVTLATEWEYDCTEQAMVRGNCPTYFFSKVMGAAQRLPNGNTLITQSTANRVFEVTPARRLVWEAYGQYRLYRSYRWATTWALRGPMPKFIW